MLDEDFKQLARRFLDEASELQLDGFLKFARLAGRFFPLYFTALGFSAVESETMALSAIHSIETSLTDYATVGRERLEAWISDHLNGVVRAAITQFRLASNELAAAVHRQTDILRFVDMPGVDVRAQYRPARLISGDFCDGIRCSDGCFVVAVGDASGKGGAAAFYAILTLGLLRAKATECSDPVELMSFINSRLLAKRPDSAVYVTLTLAKWDSAVRELTVSNAGGCHPIRLPCKKPELLRLDGEWLGTHDTISPDAVVILPGQLELFVLYSDGITDQWNEEDEQYGEARLVRAIGRGLDLPLDKLTEAVFEDIDLFRKEIQLSDDQTIVVMRFGDR